MAIAAARATDVPDLAVTVPPEYVQERGMAPGAPTELAVDFRQNEQTVHVAVTFRCVETDGAGRSWKRIETVRFPGPLRFHEASYV